MNFRLNPDQGGLVEPVAVLVCLTAKSPSYWNRAIGANFRPGIVPKAPRGAIMGMHSSETSRHLNGVEEATKTAKELLGRYSYPDDLRTVLVAGLIDQMTEHHAAMLLLIRSGMTGSAFVLARSLVEGMYRGLWVNFCANDDELRKFENEDRLPLQMKDMARGIDEKLCAGDFFVDLIDRAWKSLNSYAHTGLLQLGRRFTGHTVVPSYSDEEIDEVTTTVTTCILLLIFRFLVAQNHIEDAKRIFGLIGTYGPGLNDVPSSVGL